MVAPIGNQHLTTFLDCVNPIWAHLLKGYWTTSSCYGKGWQNLKGKLIFRPWLNIDGITKNIDKSIMKSWNHVVFHGFLRSTSTNPMPYAMNDWWEKKMLHKYDKMFFSLLDNELTKNFYKSKIRFNPSLEPPP
jgi:hypothetical protein